MSSILDLDGSTVTLNTDTTYTYYQVTDTSVGHNGKLIMSAGSVIMFDNKSGSGFDPAGTLIEVYCNGTATDNCAIISADPAPTYPWLTPALTSLVDADYTEFLNYTGSISSDYWAFNNCLWAGTRYCTEDDLRDYTNSSYQRIQLGKFIELATQEIIAILRDAGVSGAGGSGVVKEVCLKLASALMLERHRMDGSKPEMITIGEISLKNGVDNAIGVLRKDVNDLLRKYIRSNGPYQKGRYSVRVTGPRGY